MVMIWRAIGSDHTATALTAKSSSYMIKDISTSGVAGSSPHYGPHNPPWRVSSVYGYICSKFVLFFASYIPIAECISIRVLQLYILIPLLLSSSYTIL